MGRPLHHHLLLHHRQAHQASSGTTELLILAQAPPPPPPVSSTRQEDQSTGTAAPSSSKTAASAECSAWTTTDSQTKPSIAQIPDDLYMDEDTTADVQVLSSDDEVGRDHVPTVNLRQSWWKPLTEDRPSTPEPAWTIPSSDLSMPTNNWASSLKSTYEPPQENSLLAQTGDMATFMDWFCKQRGLSELTPKDLEGPAFEIYIKVVSPDVISSPIPNGSMPQTFLTDQVTIAIIRYNFRQATSWEVIQAIPALSISKMKAAYYPDVGLEQLVPDQFWSAEECKYDIAAIYQTQINLTKPRWEATRFEFKHDYTVIDSPRAVTFRDRYGVQMIMRFNEVHKFSDGTLQQIDEALDYRVKEFQINRTNPGMNTRFWTKKDVDRSKDFMFAIQKRLKTRRIFRNLESFVGGRIREGDYRTHDEDGNPSRANIKQALGDSSQDELPSSGRSYTGSGGSSKDGDGDTSFQWSQFTTQCSHLMLPSKDIMTTE
ncbi:hypothetical protein Tco_1191943 [Tanacetum coccineum]